MKFIMLFAAIFIGIFIDVRYLGCEIEQSILIGEGFIGGFLCYHFTQSKRK